jgi:hypothetical protein
MPFCPTCKSEYIEGTVKCDDCGSSLVASLEPREAEDDSRLVEVWHTQGEMDAQLIRSLLDSHGIRSMLSGESLRLTHGFTVDGLAEVRILVRDEDAKRACEVIASLEGMSRCVHCGYPVHESDPRCHACGKLSEKESR